MIMYDKSSSSNKVTRTSSSSNSLLVASDSKHGRSKAQLCLQRIIHIISSGSSEKEKKFVDNQKKKGLGIDLNIRLGCFDSNDDSPDGFSGDCSGVTGGGGGERGDYINKGENNVVFTSGLILVKNYEGECESKGVDVIEVEEEEEKRELSEVTDLETPEIEEKGGGEMEEVVVEKKTDGEKGYMGLLVEAARLISGDFKEETVEEDNTKNRDEKLVMKRRKSKRISNNSRMFNVYEDFEDISPIVKSKRGRNQVLPLKYRDSVLDPWKSTTGMRSQQQQQKSKRKCQVFRNV